MLEECTNSQPHATKRHDRHCQCRLLCSKHQTQDSIFNIPQPTMTIYHIVLFKFKALVPTDEVNAVSSRSTEQFSKRGMLMVDDYRHVSACWPSRRTASTLDHKKNMSKLLLEA